MIIFVDIDNTICSQHKDYIKAKPFKDKIEKINKLYDLGNKIVYWTARGATTGINWRELTERQLEEWGVRYHQLRFDKPEFDILFDDKAKEI